MGTDEETGPVAPEMEQTLPIPGFRRRIIVKFKDHVRVPRENTMQALESGDAGPWAATGAPAATGTVDGSDGAVEVPDAGVVVAPGTGTTDGIDRPAAARGFPDGEAPGCGACT